VRLPGELTVNSLVRGEIELAFFGIKDEDTAAVHPGGIDRCVENKVEGIIQIRNNAQLERQVELHFVKHLGLFSIRDIAYRNYSQFAAFIGNWFSNSLNRESATVFSYRDRLIHLVIFRSDFIQHQFVVIGIDEVKYIQPLNIRNIVPEHLGE